MAINGKSTLLSNNNYVISFTPEGFIGDIVSSAVANYRETLADFNERVRDLLIKCLLDEAGLELELRNAPRIAAKNRVELSAAEAYIRQCHQRHIDTAIAMQLPDLQSPKLEDICVVTLGLVRPDDLRHQWAGAPTIGAPGKVNAYLSMFTVVPQQGVVKSRFRELCFRCTPEGVYRLNSHAGNTQAKHVRLNQDLKAPDFFSYRALKRSGCLNPRGVGFIRLHKAYSGFTRQ